MTEPSLTPAQVAILERFLLAGFRFVTFERYARYIAVEKGGFVALLDPGGGKVALFGQAGYLMDEGIGMLMAKPEGQAFVYHNLSIPVTAELLSAYEHFRTEVRELLCPRT